MGRRQRESDAQAWIELIARLPWWGALLLGLVSYFVFDALSRHTVPTVTQPGQISALLIPGLMVGVSLALKWVVPMLCVMAAVVSFFRRQRASQLLSDAARRDNALATMTWSDFERMTAAYFERAGYAVEPRGGAGPDGGVDLVARKGGDRYLVQCKQWRARQVGVQIVRELYGVMAAQRAAGGFVITSGNFTEEARRFANGREIILVDGVALRRAIRSVQPVTQPQQAPTNTVPECPLCGAPMLVKVAKKGPTKGQSFWGCSRFFETGCKGRRSWPN